MIPTEKMLMVPGPVPVSESTLHSLGRKTQAHTDPAFVAEFQELLTDLRAMVNCDGIAFLVAGSGTMGMEMAVANTISGDDKILICSNGFFGDRYISICEKRAGHTETIRAKWGESVTLPEIEAKLAEGGFSTLVMTHVETSTGAEIELKKIVTAVRAKYPGIIIIVDGVAAGGGVEVDMNWGIDLYLTCTQKAFASVPGMAVIWAGKRALAKRESMGAITESYIDFARWIPVMVDTKQYWGTPPINNVWALKDAVRIMNEEGLPERYKRHREDAALIAKALAAIGFNVACAPVFRAPTLSVFLYPDDMKASDAEFRAAVGAEGALIAGCLGDFAGKGFRVGHMGNLDKHMLIAGIAAIERGCMRCGMNIKPGAALAVMQEGLAGRP